MRTPARLGLMISAAILVAFAGCKPPPESVKVKELVFGPPDLVARGGAKRTGQAYQLRAFHLNHVWSGATGRSEGDASYRAKVTVWEYDDGPAIAELYFHDVGAGPVPDSPGPERGQKPYQVHFPMSAFGPILSTLRNTNEPIFLYYYEGRWAVGTYSAEPVGID